MYTLSNVTSLQSLASAPYIVLFDLKAINEDGNWQVCMYCMHIYEKEPQWAPEHSSEHLKSQNFLGPCPQIPLTQSVV